MLSGQREKKMVGIYTEDSREGLTTRGRLEKNKEGFVVREKGWKLIQENRITHPGNIPIYTEDVP
jgi:flagellar basal body rod protein FlgG